MIRTFCDGCGIEASCNRLDDCMTPDKGADLCFDCLKAFYEWVRIRLASFTPRDKDKVPA